MKHITHWTVAALTLLSVGVGSAMAAEEIQDCETCPVMVVIPAGSFERSDTLDGPSFLVTIEKQYAMAKFELTQAEFKPFVTATGFAERGCERFRTTGPVADGEAAWDAPGFSVRDEDPVVCLSWEAANAFAAWLSDLTGETYRLPSEAEWDYAARGGAGNSSEYLITGNLGLGHAKCATCVGAGVMGREDELAPSSVGGMKLNPFGLGDVLGNAAEWTLDCKNASIADAPTDGTAFLAGNCDQRVTRGGTFHNEMQELARFRFARTAGVGHNDIGIRLLREM
jgi:formylglycine-generating enzyme required for sulfatase activity